jgi:hypothetical protein
MTQSLNTASRVGPWHAIAKAQGRPGKTSLRYGPDTRWSGGELD